MNEHKDSQLISSISAAKLVVKEIFSDDFLFSIPHYQRPYSWEEEHCTQLLDDLHTFAFKSEEFDDLPPYFLGSAVIIKKENERQAQIVDGQQRLTTLTILLSCLRYKIDDLRNKATISSLIYQSGDELLGTSATYRLKSRNKDQTFFNKLIQDEKGLEAHFENPYTLITKTDAQTQMLANSKALIEEFEAKKYDQGQLRHLAKYIIQKCVIVVVSSTDQDMAFRIFNVLNNRGKDLTISDILKSEILESITESDKEFEIYTEKWEECEIKLGTERFKDFFSYLRTIFAKRKAETAVLDEIRLYVKPLENPKNFIDNVLIPFTDAYSNILNHNFVASHYAEDINDLLVKLQRVSHSDWVPSAILFLARNSMAPIEVKNFLSQLEKVTLGMEAMKASLNYRIDRYAHINSKIENQENLYDLESELMLNERDREYIISVLTSPDLYGKRLVKPVLAKIEEQMNDCSISLNYDQLNIEHILPQTASDTYWTSRFSIEDQHKLTNNLGNLSLITVRKNSQAQNYDFNTKIEVYFKADGRASNLSMVNQLPEFEDWNPELVRKRNHSLLNYFLNAVDLNQIQ